MFRLVNGYGAGAVPWLAFLSTATGPAGQAEHCGGTLINHHWILWVPACCGRCIAVQDGCPLRVRPGEVAAGGSRLQGRATAGWTLYTEHNVGCRNHPSNIHKHSSCAHKIQLRLRGVGWSRVYLGLVDRTRLEEGQVYTVQSVHTPSHWR